MPESEETAAAAKETGRLRILTVNPGSTSTKFAVYDDEECVMTQIIRHSRSELDAFPSVIGQKGLRMSHLTDALKKRGVGLESLDAIAGRGGLMHPIESGTYLINEAMIHDLVTSPPPVHASVLGCIIAKEMADTLGIPAYVVDPIVVDEMDPDARLSGMPGIERSSTFHTLNQKAIARRLASDLGKPYENLRIIVAHLGGGITVGAHRYGRVIDVNDAMSGEGPFTPERTGAIPALPLINMCFSGEYTKQELIDRVTKSGGMQGYLGTNNMRQAQRMIDDGDEFAALVVDSMAYQLAKEIGAMATVLEGRVDAIVLTGGLAHSGRFTGAVKQRVDMLAPVHVYPGEDEMLALMQGALRVLRGAEQAAEYEG
ncbi:MAG: butyrate kinase [Oscillospiraceae bacterium]|nr:butyrate kinase [Oscillospiraceae bacterium]